MEDDVKSFLADMQRKLKSIDYVKTEDIPNIGLYMDQVTTFMEEELKACKRYDEDKILTKTMINNYAKNNLLPAPEKKKYSKEHIVTLLFIYYFKNILSISDIHTMLDPLTEHYFSGQEGFCMEDVYNEVFDLEKTESEKLLKDLGKKYKLAHETFGDFPVEDQSFLQSFSFICLLSFDVYIKKMIIESVIDNLNLGSPAAESAEALQEDN
ncbi:MAG: DUF1836 domain-containing protein [Muribaculaceae bacterium]|nr:DUF1836 domain-containing protein [Roseburia sp.]MCM1430118.1 DUF1836 domain-containing protein [Muribaculaceae bacterium]MCM1492183.1 DUF1836 domain-containing protein [Muribaculaceae bacterium]